MDTCQEVRPYDEMDGNSASVALLCLVPALAADIAGKWATVIKAAIGPMNYTIDLKAEREKLTGTAVMSMGKGSSESVLTRDP